MCWISTRTESVQTNIKKEKQLKATKTAAVPQAVLTAGTPPESMQVRFGPGGGAGRAHIGLSPGLNSLHVQVVCCDSLSWAQLQHDFFFHIIIIIIIPAQFSSDGTFDLCSLLKKTSLWPLTATNRTKPVSAEANTANRSWPNCWLMPQRPLVSCYSPAVQVRSTPED